MRGPKQPDLKPPIDEGILVGLGVLERCRRSALEAEIAKPEGHAEAVGPPEDFQLTNPELRELAGRVVKIGNRDSPIDQSIQGRHPRFVPYTPNPHMKEVLMRLTRPCFAIGILCASITGCNTVPIDSSDNSKPTVTIKVKGADGQWHEQATVDYGNNSSSFLEMMAIVSDPNGVKSINFEFHDKSVDHVYVQGGASYPGSFSVVGLPSPVGDVLSGSSGKVPTKLVAFLQMEKMYQASPSPHPDPNKFCWPGNNTVIGVRCTGGNWSSDPSQSSANKTLEIRFKF